MAPHSRDEIAERHTVEEASADEFMSSAEKYEQLAQAFNVSVSTVAFIKTRRRWKHLDDA